MRTALRVLSGMLVLGLWTMPAWSQQPASSDLTAQINGYERAAHSSLAGVPTDWSSKHLIFSVPEPGSDAEDQVQQDPRYWLQQIRRAQLQDDDSIAGASDVGALPDAKKNKKKKKKKPKKGVIGTDWSASLGTGGKVGAGNYPAKFTFVTSNATCVTATTLPPVGDFVVFNTSLAGSGTQASVMAFANLYSSCAGTVPSTYWSYNTGGTVTRSVALSLDGSQVAFMQTSGTTASLVLLKWLPAVRTVPAHLNSTTTITTTNPTFTSVDVGAAITGTGIPASTTITAVTNSTTATISHAATATSTTNVTITVTETVASPKSPVVATNAAYRTCLAPCMTSFAFTGTAPLTDSNSSPFPDYLNDTIYVGGDNGFVHKYTGVFVGTPAEVTSGFPAQAAVVKLGSPVFNPSSGSVFVTASYDGTSNGGRLHELNAASGAAIGDSKQLGPTTAAGANCAGTTAGGVALTLDGPLLDPAAGTNGTVYVFIANDGTAGTGNSAVYQFKPGFAAASCGSKITLGVGSNSGVPVYSGAFDNIYFLSSASSPTGNLYACGNAGGNATLYRVPIASNVMSAASNVPTALSTANTTCSPVTEFLNGAIDRAFLSVQASGNTNANIGCPAGGGGCVMSFNITAGTTPTTTSAKAGEPGGTSGIVIDNSSATAGASQVYFSTLGTGSSAIQASQSGLN